MKKLKDTLKSLIAQYEQVITAICQVPGVRVELLNRKDNELDFEALPWCQREYLMKAFIPRIKDEERTKQELLELLEDALGKKNPCDAGIFRIL
ncbi:MAG: hypothetical protein IJ228_08750 [Succinivibrio sp.]|nr:hypothetical protein [Succinivibrio sp.]